MLILCLLLFLDAFYRPNIEQYPYNILLDRIIPLLAISSPTIIILLLNPNNVSLLEKFGYIIIIHILVLLPLMNYWSKHRNWFTNKDKSKQWKEPKVFLDLTIAIIYPMVWGCYFTFNRYLKVGEEINIGSYFSENTVILGGIILFMWPFISFYIRILLWKFLDFRDYLWYHCRSFIISIMLFLLRYNIIYVILEKLHKLSFIWISFLIGHPNIYQKNWLTKKIHWIYLHPIVIYLFLFASMLIELLFKNGKLYYTLSFFMLILLCKPLIYLLNHFCGVHNTWINLCCIANYINYKWNNPYYPKSFWLSFNDIRESLNDYPPLTIDEQDIVKSTIEAWKKKHEQNRNKDLHIYVRVCKKNSILHRIRVNYRRWNNISQL